MPSLPPGDLARPPGDRTALAVIEQHGTGLVIDAGDSAFVTLLDTDPLVGTVKHHHTAHRVVAGERLLGIGVALRDQAFARHRGSVNVALPGEPFADTHYDMRIHACHYRWPPRDGENGSVLGPGLRGPLPALFRLPGALEAVDGILSVADGGHCHVK